MDPVGPVILAVRVAPIDQAAPADLVTMAGLAGRATTAVPATGGQEDQAAPEDLADLAGPAGRAITADQMTAVGTGARRPPICPGVGWTRAVSTTSRSTTTAGG